MAGIQDIPFRIPEQWDATWFRQFIVEVLAKMDTRNAVGSGVTITSDGNSVATIDATGDLTSHTSATDPHPQYAMASDIGVYAQKNAAETIENVWTFLAANPLVTQATTVASLPSGLAAGSRAFVTDANSTTFNATAAGGGANKVPVVYDGAAWKIG